MSARVQNSSIGNPCQEEASTKGPEWPRRVTFVALQALDQLVSMAFQAEAYVGGIQSGFFGMLEHRLLYGMAPPSKIALDAARFELDEERVPVAAQYIVAQGLPYGLEAGCFGVGALLLAMEKAYLLGIAILVKGVGLAERWRPGEPYLSWKGCAGSALYVGVVFKQYAAEKSGKRIGECVWNLAGEPIWRGALGVHRLGQGIFTGFEHVRCWSVVSSPLSNRVAFCALVIFEKGMSATLNPFAFAAGFSAGVILALARRAIRSHAEKVNERHQESPESLTGSLYLQALRAVARKKSLCTLEKEFKLFDDPMVSKLGFLATKVLDAFGFLIAAKAVEGVGVLGDKVFTWLSISPPVLNLSSYFMAYPVLEVVAAGHGKETGEFVIKVGGDLLGHLINMGLNP